MKLMFLTMMLCISSSVLASQKISGEYSTVSIADCASEIHFLKNGKGVFTDYCDGGDAKGNTTDFAWHMEKDIIHAKINGNEETFRFQDRLPCTYIGKKGSAKGLVGMDLYFWKKPIDCK